MDLLEHQGKQLLESAGLVVPRGVVATTPEEAYAAAERFGGSVVCKAQVGAGGRGKAGAVQLVETPENARAVAEQLLNTEVQGHVVDRVLIEEAVDIANELYAAVLADPSTKGPVVLFSQEGGVDIEEVSAERPESLIRIPFDVRAAPNAAELREALTGVEPEDAPTVADALARLHQLYLDADATLVEVNPLVLTGQGDVVAVDAKVTIDPSSVERQRERLDGFGAGARAGTELERKGAELGLSYIELDGDVGVLANGAGLTMTTLDVLSHYGGAAANFLEIGGDAYTKATPALELVLSNPRVRSLLVNFCGAFARTDVMAEGVVNAIEQLQPSIPVSFTIHGTGEEEAIALVRERLGIEPYDLMDDAVRAAIADARRVTEEAPA